MEASDIAVVVLFGLLALGLPALALGLVLQKRKPTRGAGVSRKHRRK